MNHIIPTLTLEVKHIVKPVFVSTHLPEFIQRNLLGLWLLICSTIKGQISRVLCKLCPLGKFLIVYLIANIPDNVRLDLLHLGLIDFWYPKH